jgi:hypothetical protein
MKSMHRTGYRRAAGTAVPVILLVAIVLTGSPHVETAGAQAQVMARGGGSEPVDDATKAAVIDSLSRALNDIYVFPEVAREMEKTVRRNLRRGEYKEASTYDDFAGMLNEDMYEIAHDRHLHIDYMRDDDIFTSPDTLTEQEEQELFDRLASNNFGFYRLERLAGNVGYLDLRGFQDATWAGATAIAAMNFLAYCDAIIIDLRRNGGGNPSMIQLISSYFFEEPVHLNSFYIRASDSTKQFWSHSFVEGPRMADTDLYILTSRFTFSAAEEFTYNMKNLERATIIGETTGGGAHPVRPVAWPGLKMRLVVPFGRAVNPITGTNWEGTGIEPHITVPEADALDVAHLTALTKLAEREGAGDDGSGIAWDIERLKAKTNPVTLDDDTMRKYVGQYGPRAITFEGGCLYYQRGEGPRMKMVPMTDRVFMFEEMDNVKVEIEMDPSGNPVAIMGLFRDGRVVRSPRD